MTKNRTPKPVYLDPGMHPGLEVKGLNKNISGLNAYFESDRTSDSRLATSGFLEYLKNARHAMYIVRNK